MKKKPRDKRYRFVSGHAVERLRERIIALDLDYRLDADLEQWLDLAVETAIRRGDVEIVMDRDKLTKLVNITDDLGAPAFALVKTNTHSVARFTEVVITVMDDIMVASYRTGRWKDDKFRTLANGLAKVRLVDPEPVTKTPRKPEADVPEEILLSYVGENGVTYEIVPRAKLRHQLIQLALDPEVDQETIRAWREVPVNVKVLIEVDL